MVMEGLKDTFYWIGASTEIYLNKYSRYRILPLPNIRMHLRRREFLITAEKRTIRTMDDFARHIIDTISFTMVRDMDSPTGRIPSRWLQEWMQR
jgi:hypothetical protein